MKSIAAKPIVLPSPEPAALAHSAALTEQIAAEMAAAGGWLGFDHYMERVLYTPGLGYYSGGAIPFGWRADDGSDFITAPELSPLFARAVANAVADALMATRSAEVIEFGAGTGKLAAGLLASLDTLGLECARYTIVELSGALRARQHATLMARVPHWLDRVRWLDTLPASFSGVAIGNEVLDAMPVRLLARVNGAWHERGVAQGADGFIWQDRPIANATVELTGLLASIDGEHDYLTETHDAARGFVSTVCAMLERGALFLIDYGFPHHEYYHPQRTAGTLICHYRHHAHSEPFFYPGLQDITAHLDFSSIAQAGLHTGANLLGFTSQARFLINCGILDTLAELDSNQPHSFLPAANAVQKLLSEAEMGELFKVIAFGRGIDTLPAFERGDRSALLFR